MRLTFNRVTGAILAAEKAARGGNHHAHADAHDLRALQRLVWNRPDLSASRRQHHRDALWTFVRRWSA